MQAQIQGDQLRVSGKKRDDRPAVQQLERGADLDIAVQFDNYRLGSASPVGGQRAEELDSAAVSCGSNERP